MEKPKLFDKSSFLSLDKCEYLPQEVVALCRAQGIHSIQSLYSLLESSPSVQSLLPEGMYAAVMKEIQYRYEIPKLEPPPQRKYNALPPPDRARELGKTVQEIEDERKRRKDL